MSAAISLLVALVAGLAQLSSDRTSDGRVLAGGIARIEGTVRWRPNRAAEPIVLDPSAAGFRRLYAGERLKCDPGARVVLVIYGRELTLDESVGWYPIPHVPGGRGMPDYGVPGGRLLYLPKPPRNIGD